MAAPSTKHPMTLGPVSTALPALNGYAIDGHRWPNTDPHRKRCKQAEFLVYRQTSWSAIRGIAVCNAAAEARVLALQANHPSAVQRPVSVTPAWYF
jgi:hypothetical protein